MKKWLIVLLSGVVLLGLGISVSIFEFSNFRIAPPPANTFTEHTETFVRSLNAAGEITIDTYDHLQGNLEIIADNSLKGQMRIEITGPDIFLHNINAFDEYESNAFYFYYTSDPFKMLSLFLDGAKDDVFYQLDPTYADHSRIIIYLNEADIPRFKNYRDSAHYQARMQDRAAQDSYNERINEMAADYNEQLEEQSSAYQERLLEMQESYEEQIENLRQDYESRLESQQENYESQLESQRENFEAQLDNLRN